MTQLPVEPGRTRLGWIGTGVMGRSMCGHLLAAGFETTVHSRTRSKADALIQAGASWSDSPGEVGKNADVIFTMVGYPDDVRQIVLGRQGLLDACAPHSIVVDMTTSQPALAVQIYNMARQHNVHALDAPVSGGDIGARRATLSIMVGGDYEAFERLQPCWQVLGKTIVFQGAAGSGQHTKMTNQILIATNMIGVCEALLYAFRAGLNLETVMQSVSSGAAGSWSLSNLGPRIMANNFDPGFFVDHFVKDMEIALDEAQRMQLQLPGLQLAHQLYKGLQVSGKGRLGTHALQLALASLSQIDWFERLPPAAELRNR